MTARTVRALRLLASATLLLAILACGGRKRDSRSEPAPEPQVAATPAAETPPMDAPHCDQRAVLGACAEFPADSEYIQTLGAEMAESVCGVGGGVWGHGACPAADRVGRCNAQGTIHSYYATGERSFTAQSAASACTSSTPPGTFVPGA